MNVANQGFPPLEIDRSLGDWVFDSTEGRDWLETEVLPQWLPTRRWFGSKTKRVKRTVIAGAVPVASEYLQVLAVCVEYAEGDSELYAVPLGCTRLSDLDQPESAVIARGTDKLVLHDGLFHPTFRAALLELMRGQKAAGDDETSLHGSAGALLHSGGIPGSSRVLGVEQSNTSIIWGERLFLKIFRRLQPGINPDAEIARYLSEQRNFPHVPPFAGELLLTIDHSEPMPFGLMLGCVENRGDAWHWALQQLGAYYANPAATPDTETLRRVAQLGQRTAELHLALSAATDDPAFQPEPLSSSDFQALASGVLTRLDSIINALRAESSPLAADVVEAQAILRQKIAALADLQPGTLKMRHHGDYHLGQVLDTGSDWMIIDFEGEPLRPLSERRAKRSPLRDVAGMLRSLHYAPHAARPDSNPATLEKAEAWSEAASHAFLDRYFAVTNDASFVPRDAKERDALLAAFVLEKALYEVDYELNNRPDWLAIPLRGVLKVARGK